MGRRDAVQVTLEVIARMRQLLPGLVVSYQPGWETRGNGTSADFEGGLVHHTASPSSLARPFPSQKVLELGRSDLPGPLCNEAGPACTVDAPRIHVMAANPANHAGASGGRSMGPLPTTSLFNKKVRGLEIDYAGSVPMLAGQLLVAHVWSRAVADVVGGGDINRIRAHYETSVTGKWDIGAGAGSVDMNAFRKTAAAIAAKAAPTRTAILEDDVPTTTVEPGRTAVLPNPYSRADLWVACDNPDGKQVPIGGKQVLVEGVALRIAVQNATPGKPTWRPAGGNFPMVGDSFGTNVPLGGTGQDVGACYAVSVTNGGHIPVTVTVSPHPA